MCIYITYVCIYDICRYVHCSNVTHVGPQGGPGSKGPRGERGESGPVVSTSWNTTEEDS